MIKRLKTDGKQELEFLKSLRQREYERTAEVDRQVAEIILQVRTRGDQAVAEYARAFDGVCLGGQEYAEACAEAPPGGQKYAEVSEGICLDGQRNSGSFEVDSSAMTCALEELRESDPQLIRAMEQAAENIRAFHLRQRREGFLDTDKKGVILGQRIRPLFRVGLYVPGGRAAYPSSVLMNAIPAKLAGVKELIMVTPPAAGGAANPHVLAAAAMAGVDRLFLMGGAQAISALAFGTATVPQVDKIVGPGNVYVAAAKRKLFGRVDIDMIAGPSEILILADHTADPVYLAADLLSQAEHDPMASAILLTTSEPVAKQVEQELARQIEGLSRQEIIRRSLADYGGILVCRSAKEMVDLANLLAPEHLEVMMENPFEYLGQLENAGSVFLGKYSPEPLGDYFSGPNHVLPTGGTARFFSPLSVDSFVKKSAFIYYSQEALDRGREAILRLAECEGLDAHANSIRVRFEEEGEDR